MDEKTRQLRDIFVEVAGEETLTERQDDSRGSLAPAGVDDERLLEVVDAVRERHGLRTSLSEDGLVAVVRGFYAGRDDAEIADGLDDVSPGTVRRARVNLHLVTDRDLDAPFDLDALRELAEDGRPTAEIADELGASESAVRRYRRTAEIQHERRLVGDRFREEFDRLVGERDLEERLVADVRETGLDDATEGMETNTSL